MLLALHNFSWMVLWPAESSTLFIYLFICILIPPTKHPDTDKAIWKKLMLIDKFFYRN